MVNKKNIFINILIMVIPVLAPAIIFLSILGESASLFAIPLALCLLPTIGLAKRLSRKDAIAFPFVQYPFLVLLFFLFHFAKPGLAFILILPMTFIINMIIGYIYFRFAKKKRWFTKVLVFLLTIVITFVIYPPIFAFLPEIESGEFPFRIVYELDGVTHEIEDVIVCRYNGVHEGYRRWSSRLKSDNSYIFGIVIFSDNDVPSAFKNGRMNEKIEIGFDVGSASYYMGDKSGRSAPSIMYSEKYRMSPAKQGTNTVTREITKSQLLEYFGIEIITWEFSEPIKNRFFRLGSQ